MAPASPRERAYFARVAEQNRALESGASPTSLDEVFERLEAIRRQHGELVRPGVEGEGEGDLAEHRALLAGLARRRSCGEERSR